VKTRRATSVLLLALCLAANIFLAACAAPGEPVARHPVVPVAIRDLTVRQSAGAMLLSFTLPKQSADRDPLAEIPSIEIYRAALAGGAAPDSKSAWQLAYTVPGARVDSYLRGDQVEFRDPLTAQNSATSTAAIAYMVRTRAARTRASQDSNYVAVNVHPVPEPPQGLQLQVTKSAIVVSWLPVTAPASFSEVHYQVWRSEGRGSNATPPRPVEIVSGNAPGTTSATQYADAHFEFGNTYTYTVRTIVRFGADEAESADSEPASVTAVNSFPLAAPTGLQASLSPATAASPAYVDLSWEISSEPELAGYHVYRGEQESSPGERIAAELLPTPTARDNSVAAGHNYWYRVTAVDRGGNESAKSAAIQVDVP